MASYVCCSGLGESILHQSIYRGNKLIFIITETSGYGGGELGHTAFQYGYFKEILEPEDRNATKNNSKYVRF